MRGNAAGLNPDRRARVRLILSALDAAERPTDLDLPGLKFHVLSGNRGGRFAVWVSHNWRITFASDGGDAIDVDMEDYHGR